MVRSITPNGPGEPPTIIVTGGEHVSVLGAVRALRAAGHAPWVTVHEPGSYAARSRATAGVIDLPRASDDPKGFIDGLAAAVERFGASVILPGTDHDMATLATYAARFPSDVVLGVAPLATIARATDKALLGDLAQSVGLDTPRTVDCGLATLADAMPIDFPVVVKPHRSELRGEDGTIRHYGSVKASSMRRLRAALADLPGERGLVQPFMQGPLGSLAGVSWEGRLVTAVQASADRVWPAPCGSISHATTVPLDERLARPVEEMLRSIGWNGIFQIDFFEASGRYLLIDLNPRFYTSLVHATQAGVNLAAIWVDLLLGRAPRVPDSYRVGLRYRHETGDLRALGRMLRHGPRRAALHGFLPERDTAYAIFSRQDPWPLLTSASRIVRRRTRSGARSAAPVLGGKGGVAA